MHEESLPKGSNLLLSIQPDWLPPKTWWLCLWSMNNMDKTFLYIYVLTIFFVDTVHHLAALIYSGHEHCSIALIH